MSKAHLPCKIHIFVVNYEKWRRRDGHADSGIRGDVPGVRSVDISEYMNYSKPSVSRAVGILKSGGYIQVEADGSILLTETGLEIGKKIYQRHTLLTDACKMEHAISDETFQALQRHLHMEK